MAAENLFMKNAREMGLIDDREIAFAADVACTNGNRGRVWFFLNGTVMNLYAMAGLADLGAHVETLDLKVAHFVKGSSFVLHTTMKLEYSGHTYSFQGFAQAKKVIEAVKDACGL